MSSMPHVTAISLLLFTGQVGGSYCFTTSGNPCWWLVTVYNVSYENNCECWTVRYEMRTVSVFACDRSAFYTNDGAGRTHIASQLL